MKKIVLFYLVLCMGMVQAMAQNRNPAYDEWLRKQGAVQDTSTLKRETTGFGVSAGIGSFYAAVGTAFGAPFSGYARGGMVNTGFGPAISLSVGNFYSPLPDSGSNHFLIGIGVDIGRGFGSAQLSDYTQGWGGINGDKPFERLYNIDSKPGYESIGQHNRFNIMAGLGVKTALSPSLTLGFIWGLGIDVWKAGANIRFQEITSEGVINRHLWTTNEGLCLSVYSESYLVYREYFFATIRGSLSRSLGQYPDESISTLGGATTLGLYVGSRFPFYKIKRN